MGLQPPPQETLEPSSAGECQRAGIGLPVLQRVPPGLLLSPASSIPPPPGAPRGEGDGERFP